MQKIRSSILVLGVVLFGCAVGCENYSGQQFSMVSQYPGGTWLMTRSIDVEQKIVAQEWLTPEFVFVYPYRYRLFQLIFPGNR